MTQYEFFQKVSENISYIATCISLISFLYLARTIALAIDLIFKIGKK